MTDLPGLIHHPDGTKSFQPRWSEEQTETLRRLRCKGLSYGKIGKRIGKSVRAVETKAAGMGL